MVFNRRLRMNVAIKLPSQIFKILRISKILKNNQLIELFSKIWKAFFEFSKPEYMSKNRLKCMRVQNFKRMS